MSEVRVYGLCARGDAAYSCVVIAMVKVDWLVGLLVGLIASFDGWRYNSRAGQSRHAPAFVSWPWSLPWSTPWWPPNATSRVRVPSSSSP